MLNTETHRIEFKLKLTEGLEKEVIAFLNYREGGTIFIGIDSQGFVKGLDDLDGQMLKIKDRLRNNILPSAMGLFDVRAEELDNKSIVKITIASGLEKPYYLKKYGMSEKGCFIRIGTAADPMPQNMIDTLYSRRVRNSLHKIQAKRQDLTFKQLKIYYEEKGFELNKQFIHTLELLTEDKKFNVVAYLMADSNGNSIKVAKYAGLDRVDLLENEEYGYESLVKATEKVLDKLDLENTTYAQITSKERKSRRLWDAVALREAVINAIVHNDYTNGIPPKFEIFSDRLEITSAGTLIDDIEQEDFFNGISAPKNPEIMRIFKDLKLVENLGSGVPRILKSYGKDCFIFMKRFVRMSFPKSEGSFVVTEKGGQEGGQIGGQDGDQNQLTKRQNEILGVIKNKPQISRKELSTYFNINQSAIQKHIDILKEKKYLKREGGTRGYWKTKNINPL